MASSAEKTSSTKIASAKGKLGIMIPGMGAVATTFMAGVEAIRKGIAEPIGSLTQLGILPFGKPADGHSPVIKDSVPLAGLKDLVFTGRDIFQHDAYEPAIHAGVSQKEPL